MNAIAFEAKVQAGLCCVSRRPFRHVAGREREIFGYPPARPTEMNEVHGRDWNSEATACAPAVEWNRDHGNGHASYFTMVPRSVTLGHLLAVATPSVNKMPRRGGLIVAGLVRALRLRVNVASPLIGRSIACLRTLRCQGSRLRAGKFAWSLEPCFEIFTCHPLARVYPRHRSGSLLYYF